MTKTILMNSISKFEYEWCLKNAELRLYLNHLLHKLWTSSHDRWCLFLENLWQPPHLSANDRSHFINVLMNALCFIQCPWHSPLLSQAAIRGDWLWGKSSARWEFSISNINGFSILYLLVQKQLNIWQPSTGVSAGVELKATQVSGNSLHLQNKILPFIVSFKCDFCQGILVWIDLVLKSNKQMYFFK